jgi:hypothetical protein
MMEIMLQNEHSLEHEAFALFPSSLDRLERDEKPAGSTNMSIHSCMYHNLPNDIPLTSLAMRCEGTEENRRDKMYLIT